MAKERAEGARLGELVCFLIADASFGAYDDVDGAAAPIVEAALFQSGDALLDLIPVCGGILMEDDDHIAEHHRPMAYGDEFLAGNAFTELRPPRTA